MTISQSIIVEITLFHFYTGRLIWSRSVKMGRSGSLNGTLKKKSMTLTYSFRFPFQTCYLSLYIPLRFRKHAINSNKMNIPKHLRLQLSFHHINDQSKPASVHDLSITVMKNSKWPNFQFLQMKKKKKPPKKEHENPPISSSICFPKPQIEHIYPIPANGSNQKFIRIMAITLRILKPNKREERKKVLKMENWRQIQIGFLQRLLQKTFLVFLLGKTSEEPDRTVRQD